MAFSSSSYSSSNNCWKHDVFLNFRGQDTRNNFTAHLHEALQKQGIDSFIDRKLERGEEISPALVEVIEGSRISIIIFSEDYASSMYCLDELVKILECRDCKGQKVLPIFYKVDPSMVAEQTGSFGEALARHEAEFMKNMETVPWWRGALTKVAGFAGLHLNSSTEHEDRVLTNIDRVKRWRAALTEAAKLAGWDLNNRNEVECIRTIVKKVINLLKPIFLHVAEHSIGLEYPIQDLNNMLSIESNEIRMVGIYGLGGIGKTTIAKAIYNSIASEFDGSCFLANVKEAANKHGIAHLQRTIISQILGDDVEYIHNYDIGINVMKKKLCNKRVLIIIDDADNVDQLYKLAGDKEWFGAKSRIIITTRDEHLLVAFGIGRKYKVKGLCYEQAIMLLSRHAFKESQPPEDFVDVSHHIVKYAQGIPLVLIVLGSFLCGRSVAEWQSELDKLKRFPKKGIYEIIKRSYDDLEDNEKVIFLDIACFFKGMHEHCVMQILYACNFDPLIGVKVLMERSLVQIDEIGHLQMHNVIQSMGLQVARQESLVLGGRRLWFNEDSLNVLTENEGTNKIEGIKIDFLDSKGKLYLKAEAFSKLKRLRILIIHNAHITGCLQNLPNLRYLEMPGCSLESISSDFYPSKLVALNIPCCNIRRFGHGIENYINLQYMDFSGCKFLKETPDFSSTPNIVDLKFSGCDNLVNIHPSIGFLNKLVHLTFYGCINLQNLTTHLRLRSLQSLDLRDCLKLEKFPEIEEGMTSLEFIYLSNTAIKELPFSMQNLVRLSWLCLKDCRKLAGVINIIKLSTLEYLGLSGCGFTSFPLWICKCTNLQRLDLSGCSQLRKIPELPKSVKFLRARNCKSLERCSELTSLFNREHLDFTNCHRLMDSEGKPLVHSIEYNIAIKNKEFTLGHEINIVLPLSEIPRCFGPYYETKYFSFQVPSYISERVIGLILCVIIGVEEEVGDLSFIVSINGRMVKRKYCSIFFKTKTELDHMWICYIPLGATTDFHSLLRNDDWNFFEFEVFVHFDVGKDTLKRFGVSLVQRHLEKVNKNYSDERLMVGNKLPEWFNYFSEDAYLSFNVPSHTYVIMKGLAFGFIAMLEESEQMSISLVINGVEFHSFEFKSRFTMELDHMWYYYLECGAMKDFQALLNNERNQCFQVFITCQFRKSALRRWGVFTECRADDYLNASMGTSDQVSESLHVMRSRNDVVGCNRDTKRIMNAPDEVESKRKKKKGKVVINN